jgi:hypothetical protein
MVTEVYVIDQLVLKYYPLEEKTDQDEALKNS